ncbi:MAG: sulfatase-like hydrolase/transferase [Rikenellaceae bacterium]
MQIKYKILLSSFTALSMVGVAQERPNIVVLLADDISAREFPIYGSSMWTKPGGGDTQDVKYRATTPVMESLVDKSCVISTCWAATVSSPTRAQLMTGRFAHQHKWWHNGDFGTFLNEDGEQESWPLYESSPYMIGRVAQMGGYATCWSGKTQMDHTDTNISKYGFDEGLYTPGDSSNKSPYTDFTMTTVPSEKKLYLIEDSGFTTDTYLQTSYFWMPSVMIVNTPENTKKDTMQPWPTTEEGRAKYGLNSYSSDIEQDYIFDFMERKQEEGKPFFVYHTSHLGHDQYNFINPSATHLHWPATPKIEWTKDGYIRTEPNITGDNGAYDTHGSISEEGIHSHINYLDYTVWRYLEKFKQMGIEDNTIFIITADNGTSRYGKGSPVCQRGTHVPFMIYAPCLDMTKFGHQDVLANIADILPTIAEVVGVEFPEDYVVDGESLIPFITTDKETHRDWIYSYKNELQMIRGEYVLCDGHRKWYDVTATPDDLNSFPLIKDWSTVSAEHRAERDELEAILPTLDLYDSEHNGPGGVSKVRTK